MPPSSSLVRSTPPGGDHRDRAWPDLPAPRGVEGRRVPARAQGAELVRPADYPAPAPPSPCRRGRAGAGPRGPRRPPRSRCAAPARRAAPGASPPSRARSVPGPSHIRACTPPSACSWSSSVYASSSVKAPSSSTRTACRVSAFRSAVCARRNPAMPPEWQPWPVRRPGRDKPNARNTADGRRPSP